MDNKVAIVGMACMVPRAENCHEYWKNLMNKKECISYNFTETDNEKEGKQYVNARGIVSGLEELEYPVVDVRYSGFVDPQLKLLNKLVCDAERDYNTKNLDEVTGIFCSTGSSIDWAKRIKVPEELKNPYDRQNISYVSDCQYYSSQIAYLHNFKGQSMSGFAACTSSAACIHMAVSSLLMGDNDCAYAGGIYVKYPLNVGYEYDSRMIFSKSGHVRTFDEGADGTVPADGGGIIVLKRLEDAMKDKDTIYAVISGCVMNNDGNAKMGFHVPSIQGISEAIEDALSLSETKAEALSFVETHGTGTYYGDCIEIEALRQAFGNVKKEICAIGSVKPNIGYLDSASGVVSVIKAAMSIRKKKYPPNINYEIPNKEMNLEDSPFYVNTEPIMFYEKKLVCGVNSLGDGGNNVFIVIESEKI